jgi:hypothetical protein
MIITEAIAEYLRDAIRQATGDDTWCRTKIDGENVDCAWVSDILVLFENAVGCLIAYGRDSGEREILESPTDYIQFTLADHEEVLEGIKRLHKANGETMLDIPYEEEEHQW